MEGRQIPLPRVTTLSLPAVRDFPIKARFCLPVSLRIGGCTWAGRTQNPVVPAGRVNLSPTSKSVTLSYHNGTTTPCPFLSVPVPLEGLNC
jgi:hypothetical protein